MAEIIKIVKQVFEIPEWYEISDVETSKLVNLIKEASCKQEARLIWMLECSAYCEEEKCYFVGTSHDNLAAIRFDP